MLKEDIIYGSLVVRIKREIYIRGISVLKLSRDLGMNKNTLYGYFNNSQIMTMSTLCKLMAYLDLFPLLVEGEVVELMEQTFDSLNSSKMKNIKGMVKVDDDGVSVCDKVKMKRLNSQNLIQMEIDVITTKYKKGADKLMDREKFYSDLFVKKK